LIVEIKVGELVTYNYVSSILM